jgi:4'-phosphopantetheinyl transferase
MISQMPSLPGREIHVWQARIDAPPAHAAGLEYILSPDEKERAGRFVFEHLKSAFIVARGTLRVLLGNYLGIAPRDVLFRYGTNGKPALAEPGLIDFNASHSDALAVFAFTRGCEIGIDVEKVRPIEDMRNIADHFFCAEEAEELMSLEPGLRERAFFNCWTRKEAYIKAIGKGLSEPLDSFRVSLEPGRPARLIHIRGNALAAEEWTFHDLPVASGYVAALAYRDNERPVVMLESAADCA